MGSVKSIIEATYNGSKMIDRAYDLSSNVSLNDVIKYSLEIQTLKPSEIINFILERTEITIKKCTQLQQRSIELKNEEKQKFYD